MIKLYKVSIRSDCPRNYKSSIAIVFQIFHNCIPRFETLLPPNRRRSSFSWHRFIVSTQIHRRIYSVSCYRVCVCVCVCFLFVLFVCVCESSFCVWDRFRRTDHEKSSVRCFHSSVRMTPLQIVSFSPSNCWWIHCCYTEQLDQHHHYHHHRVVKFKNF